MQQAGAWSKLKEVFTSNIHGHDNRIVAGKEIKTWEDYQRVVGQREGLYAGLRAMEDLEKAEAQEDE